MMNDERIETYLRALDPPLPDFLDALEQETRAEFLPIICRDTQSVLRTLLTLQKPERLLEIGTATGFSALFTRYYAPEGAKITTIESYEPRIKAAKEHFREAGAEGDITLLEGDALEILPGLSDVYDFIFLDAAKGQYINMLPRLLELLAPGGLLVTDDALADGRILESRYVIRQRDRTIYSRTREYLYAITHESSLVTTILPAGGGIALSVKK